MDDLPTPHDLAAHIASLVVDARTAEHPIPIRLEALALQGQLRQICGNAGIRDYKSLIASYLP